MLRKIIGFGDSWMWGDELIDPDLSHDHNAHPALVENTQYRESNCFLGQLGAAYGVPVENFGWPGASLQSTIWSYLWWLDHSTDHDDTLVIVVLTDASRQSWYNPQHVVEINDPPWHRFMHSAWIQSSDRCDDWNRLEKLHTTLTDCEDYRCLNYKLALTFFQGQKYRHPVCLLVTSEPPATCHTHIPELVIKESIYTWLKNVGRSRGQNLFMPKGHPNEHGHRFVRDLLIKHIDDAILA